MNRFAESTKWPAVNPVIRPIAELAPALRNARQHPEGQIDQLRASLREFGWTTAVLVDEDGRIIAGHGRVEAAKREGMTEVPVIVATGWTEAQCRAYALADNRIPLNATWDEANLGLELQELSGLGVDLGTLGFGADEAAALSGTGAGTAGLTDPEATPEPPAVPVATRGDVWLLGGHRLLCGNSESPEDVKRALSDVAPHLMVTDPPYGVNYDPMWRATARNANGSLLSTGTGRASGKVENDGRSDWREAWALFPGDVVYVWHGGSHAHIVAESLIACNLEIRAQIIWAKSNLVVGRGHYHPKHEPCWYAVRKSATGHWAGDRKQTTLWQIDKPQKSETGHSTQKPVDCMKRPIENNSKPGDCVYDPFVGSGTTIIAAEMTGRRCIAIEIDPTYVDVAILRWQDFTGQKATLEGDGSTFEDVASARSLAAA